MELLSKTYLSFANLEALALNDETPLMDWDEDLQMWVWPRQKIESFTITCLEEEHAAEDTEA